MRMRWSWLRAGVVLASVLGCGGSTSPTRPPAPPVGPAAAPIPPHAVEDARNLEAGRGVARDYLAAARLYALACRGGHGDLEACKRLDALALRRRGADIDDSIYAMRSVLCTRGVEEDCITGPGRRAPSSCAEGNWHQCGNSLEASGCGRHQTPACFDELARRARHPLGPSGSNQAGPNREQEELDDARKLIAACDAGELDACNNIPGREVPLDAQCRAHDFAVCHLLACGDDAAAAAIDRAHPAPQPVHCMLAQQAQAAERSWRTDMPTLDLTGTDLPPLTDEPQPVFRPADVPAHATLRARALGDRYHGWPYFQVYNVGRKDVLELAAVAYGYDAAGRLVARTDDDDRLHPTSWLHPGDATTIVFGSPPPPPAAVHFELCYDAIQINNERVHIAGHCPTSKLAGAPALGPDVTAVLIDPTTAKLLAPVNQAFERAHPDVTIAAVSSTEITLSDDEQSSLNRTTWDARLPLVARPVAIYYNLPGRPALRLSPRTLAKLLTGAAKQWNDPAIVADNPGVALPALEVAFVYGFTGRGAVTAFVCRAVPDACKDGALAFVSSGAYVPSEATTRSGAITFAPALGPGALELPAALIRNAAGQYVAPTGPHATQAELDATYDPDLAFQSFRDRNDPVAPPPIVTRAPRKDAYPMVTVTWAYVGAFDFDADMPYDHPGPIAPQIAPYLQFILRDGQPLLEAQGYGRLPRALLERALAHLSYVRQHGLAVAASRPRTDAWVQTLTIRFRDDYHPELKRTQAEADVLAQRLLARARAGVDLRTLRAQVPDDVAKQPAGEKVSGGSFQSPIQAVATSLQVGEVGMVRVPTQGGSRNSWVLIKRIPAPRGAR